ncbi:MAG: hypothetical protein P1V36_14105, partial [Planctomycetota bacterium]|nr:hypothetical protein [Planctomycetota bacterium]
PWLPGGSEPAPAAPQPAQPADPKPAPVDEDDPWLPGGTGAAPAGTNPGTTETPPAQPVVDEDDPWQEGGTTSTPGQPTPGQPAPTQPATREPEAGTPMGRAMAHVTKLLDRPGAPEVCGYPAEVVRSDDAGMALTPGVKPVLLVFFDDSMRASDLQAAQLLPMVLRNRQRIDFVAIDRGAGAKRTRGTDELSLRFLDHVPTIVLLDAQRTTRLLRSGRVDAAVVERAIEDAIANPTPAPEKPDAAQPGSPDVPASPGSVDPFDQQPQGDDPAARTGVTFTPPSDHSARTHVQRLRSGPGDARVPGYPSDLLPSAPAGRVLGAGQRPCVIVFYDNASKASDLQAAAFLELLVRRRSEIDIVLVDVGTKATWDADQKRVVRTYYNFYVPTTVVLSAARAPVKSWYSRVEAAALDDAIDDALSR